METNLFNNQKTNQYMKNISLIAAVLLMSVNVFGQKLPNEQVESLADFEVELAQTQKN